MNILVIGSGGREHAICWKLQQSSKVSNVYVLPGSEAIASLPKTECVKGLNLKDFKVRIENDGKFSCVKMKKIREKQMKFRNQFLLLSENANNHKYFPFILLISSHHNHHH